MASKSSGIDYSKWDKMDFSDDDTDDDDNEKGMTMPRVTRLDTPSSITTTRDGTVQITKNISPPPTKMESTTKSSSSSSKEDPIRQERINDEKMNDKKEKEEWTQNGDSFIDEQFHQKIQTYWCQDRYEVILSIIIVDDDTTTEKEHNKTNRQYQVNVKGPLLVSYADRFSAMGVGTTTQTTKTKTKTKTNTILTVVSSLKRNNNNNNSDKKRIVFQGMLPHPIHLAEDEENVEWELLVSHHHAIMNKVLRITFRKALPMQGLTIWWDQPLYHFPKINLQTDIQERRNSNTIKDNTKMKQVWDEAHTLFREKMKQKKKEEQ